MSFWRWVSKIVERKEFEVNKVAVDELMEVATVDVGCNVEG